MDIPDLVQIWIGKALVSTYTICSVHVNHVLGILLVNNSHQFSIVVSQGTNSLDVSSN